MIHYIFLACECGKTKNPAPDPALEDGTGTCRMFLYTLTISLLFSHLINGYFMYSPPHTNSLACEACFGDTFPIR